MRLRKRIGQRLLWLSRRAENRTTSLDQLEDSHRPLLFSLLPRMLRGDGATPRSLQGAFQYIDQRAGSAPAVPVSRRRWRRALATSRRLAVRRVARERVP